MADENPGGRPLFAVGADVYGWDEVVSLARLRGDWAALGEQARAGLAALAVLEARGQAIADEDVEAAGREFRYARDLLAGEELADWLERRSLTSDDWHAYLCRMLARQLLGDLDASAVSEEEAEACVWAEGICSGRLEELARELAELVAVAPGTPLERLDEAFEAFCTATVDEEAIAHEVQTNRLEWLRFGFDAIALEEENAALEAALCVRADGDSLAVAATRAGVDVDEREDWLDAIEPELATRFLAAQPGDLIGPVAVDGRFVVAHVLAKTAPSLDDESVRSRAEDAVAARAVARAVNDRVTWLDRP